MSRNVRSASMRKRGSDGKPFTATEEHRKASLMRQFLQLDGPKGSSEEYRKNFDLIRWDE